MTVVILKRPWTVCDITSRQIQSAVLPAGTHEVETIQFNGALWLVLTGAKKIGATSAYWRSWKNEVPDQEHPNNRRNLNLITWGDSEVVIRE